MNSITRTLLFLSGNCLASWEQIRIAMEQLEAKVAANGTQVNIQSASGNMPLNREFGGLISSFMVDISQYGCWCYLDGNYQGNARGAPVDWIDQQCKRLVNGYKCASMDAVVRGESCEAHTVDYTPYDYFSAWDPIDVECTRENAADLCAQAACIIEGKFVMDFFPQFFGGITYDPQFQHPEVGGSFDTAVECPYGGSGKQADTDRECCGEYISGRAPFKTRNRECCGNTVINPLHMQCCAGGVSQPVGQVC